MAARLCTLTAALGLAATAGAQVDSSSSIASARMRTLVAEAARDPVGAERRFWATIRSTPIVEADIDSKHRLVTFVYHGDSTTHGALVVALQNDQLGNAEHYPLAVMQRVGGTAIWYRSYRFPSSARFSYRVGPDLHSGTRARLSDAEWAAKVAALKPDPLNPRRTPGPNDGDEESVAELPDAPPQRWLDPSDSTRRGRTETFQHHSAILGNDRTLSLYIPKEPPRNLLVVLDGEGVPGNLPVPTILDNLTKAGVIQPTAALMIGNAAGVRVREMWYSEDFARAVTSEMMARVVSRFPTIRCPQHCAIAGRSIGGSAAMFIGFRFSDRLGGVVAQSGGFHYAQNPAEWGARPPRETLVRDDSYENEWLTRIIAQSTRKPLRVYLEVGRYEDVRFEGDSIPRHGASSLLVAHRHLRDVLTARGYSLRYNEYDGGHRALNWRGTFGDAVAFVLAKPRS